MATGETGAASLEKALSAENRQRRSVEFLMAPWGGRIRVCALTEDEGEAFSRETIRRVKARKRDKTVFTRVVSRALIATIHSMEGGKFFKDEHESALSEQLPNIPRQLRKLALEMAGLTEDDADELEGN